MKLYKNPIAAAVSATLLILSAQAHAQTVDVSKTEEQKAAEANQASKKATTNLGTVTVTSGKRAEAIHKIPYNVSAITEEQLREDNITDIKKLVSQSDAISAPGNSARFADSVTVRGLNVSSVSANNIEQFVRSTLAYYLDDTLLPNIGYRIKDVARVETLLGPQGTLYGAGSLGGTVRYITNKPKLGRVEGSLNTSFYQTKNGGLSNDTDAVINLPLGDSVALRASFARLDEKGYTDRLSTPPWRTGPLAWDSKPNPQQNLYEDDDWQKVEGGRVALLWRVMPGLELSYSHAEQKQLANGTSGASLLPVNVANATNATELDAAWRLNRAPCVAGSCVYTDRSKTPFVVNDHTILSRYPEFADRRFKLDTIGLDWDLGFARLNSNTSSFSDSRQGQADYASQGNAFYNWFTAGNVRTSNNSLYMTFDNSYKGIQNETRLTSTGTGPMNWIAGFYFTEQERNWRFDEMLPGLDKLPSQGDFVTINRKSVGGTVDSGYAEDLGSKSTETAFFGEIGYAVTDKWKVMAGGRVFNYKDKGSAIILDYAGGLADTNTRGDSDGTGKSYYKLNTSYQATDDLLAYATYSQGFRRGGNNAFRDYKSKSQIVAPETQSFSPDSTDNIEIGLKGFALNRQLYLQASLYQIDWKNVQTYFAQQLPDPFGVGVDFPLNGTVNGPNARSKGFELSTRYRFNENWQMRYSTSTTDAEWVTSREVCTYVAGNRPGSAGDPNGPDCRNWDAGGKLNGAPKWKHNVGVRFTGVMDEYDLSAGLNARYVSKIGNDRTDSVSAEPPLVYPAYTVLNANIGVSKGPWSASLWVQNLADLRAQVSVQTLSDTITGPRMIYTTPRTVGMNLSYYFK